MRKVKAVVAGFEGRSMVVLTRDGQFTELPIPKSPPALGEEIEIKERIAPKSFRPFLAAAAALLLVFALGLFNPLADPVAAYVTVDINPGVELWVDRDANVIKIKPLSEDAEKVIAGISIKDKNLYETTYAIIENSLALGYLEKTNKKLLMVSVTPVKYQAEGSVDEARLQKAISDQLMSYQISGYVVISKADSEQREQAQEKGLSVNRLLVYRQAEKRGVNIPENTRNDRDMLQVLQELNLSVKDLFGNSAVEIQNDQLIEHSYQAKAEENVRQQERQLPQTENRQENRSDSPGNMNSGHETARSEGGETANTIPGTAAENSAGQVQPGEDNQKNNTGEATNPKDDRNTSGEGKGDSHESSTGKKGVNSGKKAPTEGNQDEDKGSNTDNGGDNGGSSSGDSESSSRW